MVWEICQLKLLVSVLKRMLGIMMYSMRINMRTTIQLDDQLHEKARQYALNKGTTFAALMEEALREKLLARPKHSATCAVTLKTVNGQGVQAGVDLDDTAALLGLMDTD